MAEQALNPDEPDAAASVPRAGDRREGDRRETVRVRRAPKFSVFLLLGAAVGVAAALTLTFAFGGTLDESPNTGLIYSQGQVFGFLTLICVTVCVALAGVIALVLDRFSSRHTREVAVDHESVEFGD